MHTFSKKMFCFNFQLFIVYFHEKSFYRCIKSQNSKTKFVKCVESKFSYLKGSLRMECIQIDPKHGLSCASKTTEIKHFFSFSLCLCSDRNWYDLSDVMQQSLSSFSRCGEYVRNKMIGSCYSTYRYSISFNRVWLLLLYYLLSLMCVSCYHALTHSLHQQYEVRGLQHPVPLSMGIMFNVIITFFVLYSKKKYKRLLSQVTSKRARWNKSYPQWSISIDAAICW